MTNWLAGMIATAARLNDTTLTTLSGTVTPASGWTVSSFQAVKDHGTTTVQVEMIRTGGTITAASSGMVSPANLVCTLPYVPPWQMWTDFQVANATAGSILINPDGTTYIQVMYPSQSIVNTNTIYFAIGIPTG